jgi:integrase
MNTVIVGGNRRALTEDEITRLLRAAELRPIAELGRESVAKPDGEKSGRSTWTKAELTFDTIDAAYQRGLNLLADQPERINALMFVGRQRALMYRMMICTGLRKSELASITLGQTHLDGRYPSLELLAKDEKAGRGAMIPLRADLVNTLHAYIDDMQARSGTTALRHDTHLFPMPKDMIRVFDRDLAAASISKRDDRDRAVDLHALRHTFGTHLARAGVAPRVAMAAMRHSSLELTMNVYTDPALLDVAGPSRPCPPSAHQRTKSPTMPFPWRVEGSS